METALRMDAIPPRPVITINLLAPGNVTLIGQAPHFMGGERTVRLVDATCRMSLLPDGEISIRIIARRSEAACATVIDAAVPWWVRMLQRRTT